MNFTKPMTIELSGQEVATVITGLMKLPGEVAFDLICKFRAVNAEVVAQDSKVPGPDLKLVSGELMPK